MDFNKISPINLKYKLIYQGDVLTLKGDCYVASYDENTLIIKCGKKNICLAGNGLVIDSMNTDELIISGSFNSISFE